MAAAAESPRFEGFADKDARFFKALARNQRREWFAAHRTEYEEGWLTPMRALLAEARERLDAALPDHPLGEPKVFRIHRDVRFSRDKAPYKTHIAGVIRLGGSKIAEAGNAVLYLHLGLDEEYVGVGCYQFDERRMARWRRAVVGAPGRELLQLLARLRRKGYDAGPYEEFARVPKGFAPDHPRAELLKYKGLICRFPAIPAGLLRKPELARWLLGHAKATAPLVIWLRRNLG